MKISTLGTILTMISGIGGYALVMATITLATHSMLPEDPDGTLFYIGSSLMFGIFIIFILGIIINSIGNRREYKKQKVVNDSTANKNTQPL